MDNKISNLKDLVIDELTNFFEAEDNEVKEKADKAKIALGTLSAVGRLIGTERVKDAMQFNIIKTITDDTKAREDYIKATLPQYCPKKINSLEE